MLAHTSLALLASASLGVLAQSIPAAISASAGLMVSSVSIASSAVSLAAASMSGAAALPAPSGLAPTSAVPALSPDHQAYLDGLAMSLVAANFTTLARLVPAFATSPAIMSALTGPGTYTLLAPTDAAFLAAANQSTTDANALVKLLSYHLVNGTLAPVSALQGSDRVVLDTVPSSDNSTARAVVFAAGPAILQPGTQLAFTVQTLSLPEINATSCSASSMPSGVSASGSVAACSTASPSAYFAPMNTLARRQVASVASMPVASASVVSAAIASASASSSAVPMASSTPVAAAPVNGTMSYRNLAINPIPRLLVQPTDLTAAMDRNNITAWPALIDALIPGFNAQMASMKDATFFIPTDAAITNASLTGFTREDMARVLMNHVVNASATPFYSPQLSTSDIKMDASSGSILTSARNATGLFVNLGNSSAQLIHSDVVTSSSAVVHIVDHLLLGSLHAQNSTSDTSSTVTGAAVARYTSPVAVILLVTLAAALLM